MKASPLSPLPSWKKSGLLLLHTTTPEDARTPPLLLLVPELVGEPVKAFVQAVAAGGTGGLDVPVAVAQGVKAQLVGYLSSVHGIWQVLEEEGGWRETNLHPAQNTKVHKGRQSVVKTEALNRLTLARATLCSPNKENQK